MPPILRRSSRSRKISSYHVGDIVEIRRNGGKVSNGRLTSRMTEDNSPNPLWQVTFDGDMEAMDEQVHELSFGRLVRMDADSQDESSRDGASAASRSSSPVAGSPVTSSSEADDDSSSKRHVSFAEGTSPPASDDGTCITRRRPVRRKRSTKMSTAGAAARAQRSLRRQMEKQPPKRKTTSGAKQIPTKKRTLSTQSMKTAQQKDNEEVTKVKLNTGTLYLYRGANRRAEFVRHY
eukprot:CAMPEP_0198289546 /NCGR_PEP_ID=MMETSP1449-20131203/7689_1 /TAXON_ID=420275 /ORGANISM="Attheya septentrionalis, Strain CCMP2084" /LENGTH=234 /DNA_ID=CAMNT_0043987885 /DNA_START=118 /DNA_END=822 /DNA_ORIENTATION=+